MATTVATKRAVLPRFACFVYLPYPAYPKFLHLSVDEALAAGTSTSSASVPSDAAASTADPAVCDLQSVSEPKAALALYTCEHPIVPI